MFSVRYERSSLSLHAFGGVAEVELRFCGFISLGKGFEAQAEGGSPLGTYAWGLRLRAHALADRFGLIFRGSEFGGLEL